MKVALTVLTNWYFYMSYTVLENTTKRPGKPPEVFSTSSVKNSVHCWKAYSYTVHWVRTDPGKVWKVVEFKEEIFQVSKIMEIDIRYGKVWKKIMESVTFNLEN